LIEQLAVCNQASLRDARLHLQNNSEEILMLNATKVILKKNAKTQYTVPVMHISQLVQPTIIVYFDAPMTMAKYKKDQESGA